MPVKRIENEFCPKVGKPCIEDACAAWKTTRIMPEVEYHMYMRSDIPVDRIMTGCRWCALYEKDIPIVLESVVGENSDNQNKRH